MKSQLIDFVDVMYHRLVRRSDLPPWSLRRHGGPIEEFERIPQEYIAYFKLLCGVDMKDTVLDIGCGVGRFAMSLLQTPNFFRGEYYGFDIERTALRWAHENIRSDEAKIDFRHVDLFNTHYNPGGKLKADEFDFPYPTASMDFAFAISLFTHLLADDARNYMNETSRVLKPGGKALFTFLLLEGRPERVSKILEKRSPRKGGPTKWHHHDIYSVVFPENPEAIVAFQRDAVEELATASGLRVNAIYPGAWNTAEGYLSFQDIVIVEKAA